MLCCIQVSIGQTASHDLQILRQGESPIASTTFHRTTFIGLGYKMIFKPQLGRSCVFEMECGQFCKSVVGEFGLVKGTFLAIDRIARCSHISVMETLPVRLSSRKRIIETPADFRLR